MPDQEEQSAEPVSIYEALIAMIDTMASFGWQKLGLQPDIRTGKIVANLEEAKVAIDITTHLASFVEPKLDEEDKREMHNLIRNLRLNYVQKSQENSQ